MAQDKKKVLVEVYKWYGGSLQPEYSHELIGEDSQEFRKQVVDSNIPNHAHIGEKELAQFIQGETDNIYIDLEVTDWDEPQAVSAEELMLAELLRNNLPARNSSLGFKRATW